MIGAIGILGLGEVGEIFAVDLQKAGAGPIYAFDLKFSEVSSGPSQTARRLGLNRTASAAEVVASSNLVISAVTAAECVAVAGAAAPGLKDGGFYLDVNSVSPGAKIAASQQVAAGSGRFVEAAIMSPIAPRRLATAMLLGGPDAAPLLDAVDTLGFTGAKVFSADIGKASAAKMCRSVLVKGMEALLTESLMAARRYDVLDSVMDSLGDLFPLPDWPRLARYMISRSAEHGARRAEEMRESARTVAEAGVEPLITAAIAERQQATAGHRDCLSQAELRPFLDALIKEMSRP